jgi:hypothetical protein
MDGIWTNLYNGLSLGQKFGDIKGRRLYFIVIKLMVSHNSIDNYDPSQYYHCDHDAKIFIIEQTLLQNKTTLNLNKLKI